MPVRRNARTIPLHSSTLDDHETVGSMGEMTGSVPLQKTFASMGSVLLRKSVGFF